MHVRRNVGSARSVEDTSRLPGRTTGSVGTVRSSGSSWCATAPSSHRHGRGVTENLSAQARPFTAFDSRCLTRADVAACSPQGERGLGLDAGQLLRIADVVKAGDAGVLDMDGHDAVDLAVQMYDECRVAVDHGGTSGEHPFGPAETTDDEADDLLGADDRSQHSLLDAAAVTPKDDLGSEHVEEALQVPGFDRALERLQRRPGFARGNHLARV